MISAIIAEIFLVIAAIIAAERRNDCLTAGRMSTHDAGTGYPLARRRAR